jgi:SagB-type dehydrogenase family enzyme
LEIYIFASRVSGLAAGAYHYDPFEHRLAMLGSWDQQLEQIQDQFVCRPARLSTAPQAVLYLTSVVRRVAWKYPSGVLSLIYRDAGCLLQTMYLVATDLGLAPCAIAGIDADLSPAFLQPYREEMVHVGSFGLGVRDAEDWTSPDVDGGAC